MALKSLLVHLPSKVLAPNTLDAATNLASKHGAHLTGLHLMLDFPPYGDLSIVPADVWNAYKKPQREEAAAIKDMFEKAVAAKNIPADWRSFEVYFDNAVEFINTQALSYDLLIVGKTNTDAAGSTMPPERLILEGGRPVLVVPDAPYPSIGTRIMIAWNNSRESARAVFEAMPLLEAASMVKVLAVNPDGRNDVKDLVSGQVLAETLKRHGVKASAAETFTEEASVGELLLSRIADEGCDLLVMGCYGHSRLREMVFGGVTRHVMAHATVPLFMTH